MEYRCWYIGNPAYGLRASGLFRRQLVVAFCWQFFAASPWTYLVIVPLLLLVAGYAEHKYGANKLSRELSQPNRRLELSRQLRREYLRAPCRHRCTHLRHPQSRLLLEQGRMRAVALLGWRLVQ